MVLLALGIFLGLLLGYPIEAHRHPLPWVGAFPLATVWICFCALGGKLMGGLGGRATILGAGLAEGLLLVVMIFPINGGSS